MARQLAERLTYTYIDTGAMYRAVTLYFLDNNINIKDETDIEKAIQAIHIDFVLDGNSSKQITLLNNLNVEEELRSFRVSNFVSEVSTLQKVRSFLVDKQQQMGLNKGIVMDGRDIGTVVFPQASLKLFVTAKPKVRAKRRFYEMKEMGIETTLEEVQKNLNHRDSIDSNRAISPLKKANDAIVIDNSDLTMEDQLKMALQLVEDVLKTLA